jgi:tetratricopeptide (TPR) repeat protein
MPDFSEMEAPAREQMQVRFSSLRSRIEDPASTPEQLATAYGDTGKLLMAATHLDPAEACYLNAQTLAPGDRRWPYYLCHLYKTVGPLDKSVASFERALALSPNDVATLVWLGEVHLAQGHADAADPLFAKALSVQPSAAAWFGSGRAALATREYARAVNDLTQALVLDPRATSIQYPLAMAYRGAGDLAQAEAHLARQGDIETRPVDPLMRELDELLQLGDAERVVGMPVRDVDHRELPAALEDLRRHAQQVGARELRVHEDGFLRAEDQCQRSLWKSIGQREYTLQSMP